MTDRCAQHCGETYVRISTAAGIATVVGLGGGQGEPGGAWYWEIPADGRAPLFEFLPADAFIGDIAASAEVPSP